MLSSPSAALRSLFSPSFTTKARMRSNASLGTSDAETTISALLSVPRGCASQGCAAPAAAAAARPPPSCGQSENRSIALSPSLVSPREGIPPATRAVLAFIASEVGRLRLRFRFRTWTLVCDKLSGIPSIDVISDALIRSADAVVKSVVSMRPTTVTSIAAPSTAATDAKPYRPLLRPLLRLRLGCSRRCAGLSSRLSCRCRSLVRLFRWRRSRRWYL